MSHICEYRKFKTWWHPSSNVKIEHYVCDVCGHIKVVNVPLDLDTYTSTATRTCNVSFVEAGKEKLRRDPVESYTYKPSRKFYKKVTLESINRDQKKVEREMYGRIISPNLQGYEEVPEKVEAVQEKIEEVHKTENIFSKPAKKSIWQRVKKLIFG